MTHYRSRCRKLAAARQQAGNADYTELKAEPMRPATKFQTLRHRAFTK